jgi:hypothetical protein
MLLLLNLALVVLGGGPLWALMLVAQVAFYGWAALGWYGRNRPAPARGWFIPMYFCMMNVAVYLGFLRFVRRQTVLWDKAERATHGRPLPAA